MMHLVSKISFYKIKEYIYRTNSEFNRKFNIILYALINIYILLLLFYLVDSFHPIHELR